MSVSISATPRILLVFCLFALGCSGGADAKDGTGGASGTGASTGGIGGTGVTGGSAGMGAGGTMVVPTPEGTLFMDGFEAGATNWDVTQGTCSIAADDATNVYTCINNMMNEARAVAGSVWGEYSVSARIRLNALDPLGGRRIYLAGRFTDSNNWYGAAIYDGAPFEIQIRKKVAGTSSDIARTSYPFELGVWYTLKLEMKGSTLSVSVDDALQLTTMDTSFASGKIALLVDRTDVSWDDVLVTNP